MNDGIRNDPTNNLKLWNKQTKERRHDKGTKDQSQRDLEGEEVVVPDALSHPHAVMIQLVAAHIAVIAVMDPKAGSAEVALHYE